MSGEFKATTRLIKDLDSQKFQLLRRRANMDNKTVRVGLPSNKVYREKGADGKLGKALAFGPLRKAKSQVKRMLISVIGAIMEFGAPERKIPARPWLRPGIRSGTPDYIRLNRRNLLRVLDGTMTSDMALKQLGAMAVGKVQAYIRVSSHFQALKAATIRRKGSSKPLIDTGQLIQSVTYEVADKDA